MELCPFRPPAPAAGPPDRLTVYQRGPMSKSLHRSSTNSIIAGVCGGLAEYFEVDPTLVRVIYVIVSIVSVAFPGILIYLVLWFLMPRGGE